MCVYSMHTDLSRLRTDCAWMHVCVCVCVCVCVNGWRVMGVGGSVSVSSFVISKSLALSSSSSSSSSAFPSSFSALCSLLHFRRLSCVIVIACADHSGVKTRDMKSHHEARR